MIIAIIDNVLSSGTPPNPAGAAVQALRTAAARLHSTVRKMCECLRVFDPNVEVIECVMNAFAKLDQLRYAHANVGVDANAMASQRDATLPRVHVEHELSALGLVTGRGA